MVADRRPGYPEDNLHKSARPSAARLILASGSVTRARLLRAAGVDFAIEVPAVDEPALRAGTTDGAKAAGIIGTAKARAISVQYPSAWVIGSDQVLALDATLLGKPGNRTTAREQLGQLSGRTHRLLTSVTVARGGETPWQHLEVAELTVRRLSPAAIDRYLAAVGDEVLGSPGAYHLEGLGASLFESVQGDYFSILGLPLLPLLGYLRSQGVIPE
jgi:septum formation protein